MMNTKAVGSPKPTKQASLAPTGVAPSADLLPNSLATQSSQAALTLRIQWDAVTGRYCSAIRAKRIEKKVML